MRRIAAASFFIVTLLGLASALDAQVSSDLPRTGSAAFGDWRDDAPGVRRLITAQDLPSVEKETANGAAIAAMPPDARPQVPFGFSVELVTRGLRGPRAMRVAPNGDLFVADSDANQVLVFRLAPGSTRLVASGVFATGLHQPYGIAFYPLGPNPQWIYIANTNSLVRLRYHSGDLKASAAPEPLVEHLPAGGGHWTRDLAIAPDGGRVYLSVGSGSNVAQSMPTEPDLGSGLASWASNHPLGASWDGEDRRAVILSFDPDGRHQKTVATGLRNPSGITIQPATGQLWTVVNERDNLGDNTPFDYATQVRDGAFYGWPWYYIGDHQDPRHRGERPDLHDRITIPDVLFQAHSAPLQIVFYEGANFPPDYRGDAFVTLHGSWDRGRRTGYKVVRLLFDKSGRPTGQYEDFMTGMVLSDRQVWGRPVGVAVAADGALLVSEDANGSIWRISHTGSAHS